MGNGNAVSAADDDELSNKGHDNHENYYASMAEDDAATDGSDSKMRFTKTSQPVSRFSFKLSD